MAAPNTALQRTRVRPADGRSPLSRKPFGARHLLGLGVPLFAFLAVLACSSSPSQSSQTSGPELECPTPARPSEPPARLPTPPHLIKKVELPSGLESGLVCLEGTIGGDGAVHDLVVVRSGGAKLDRIALATVQQWRYQPAVLDGVPISVPLALSLRVQHH